MGEIVNIDNYGMVTGRVSHLKNFINRDGSIKYMVTVAAPNKYMNDDGTRGSQFVRMEDFIPKNAQSKGVYEFLDVGDYVRVTYTAKNDDYRDKDGKWHYGMVLSIDSVDMLETKEAREARRAKRAKEAAENNNGAPKEDTEPAAVAADNGGSAFGDDYELIFD